MLFQKIKELSIPVMIAWWNVKALVHNTIAMPGYIYSALRDRPMLGFMGINEIADHHKDSVLFTYSCDLDRTRQIGRALAAALMLSLGGNLLFWFAILTN